MCVCRKWTDPIPTGVRRLSLLRRHRITSRTRSGRGPTGPTRVPSHTAGEHDQQYLYRDRNGRSTGESFQSRRSAMEDGGEGGPGGRRRRRARAEGRPGGARQRRSGVAGVPGPGGRVAAGRGQRLGRRVGRQGPAVSREEGWSPGRGRYGGRRRRGPSGRGVRPERGVQPRRTPPPPLGLPQPTPPSRSRTRPGPAPAPGPHRLCPRPDVRGSEDRREGPDRPSVVHPETSFIDNKVSVGEVRHS